MAKITNQQVLDKLSAKFGDKLSTPTEPFNFLTVDMEAAIVNEALAFLKNDAELRFNYLTDITDVHYPGLEKELCVVYHLHSLYNNIRIRIKAYVPLANPAIATATNLWEGANWMERETYDYFGIQFVGHPNLVRILNVDDMTVFPMRREYQLEDPNRVDKKDFFFGR